MKKRRQLSKCPLKRGFSKSLTNELDSILATIEILSDRKLTGRLLKLSKRIDADVAAERLLTTVEVFDK